MNPLSVPSLTFAMTARGLARCWGLYVLGLLSVGCLELRDQDEPEDTTVTRCATCHGDPKREGDFLLRSAPPIDLNKNTAVEYPSVGAHLAHLLESDTHDPVPCTECHIVPDAVDAPGHADDDRPAEVVFGALAKMGDRSPEYVQGRRRCSDTYCHGQDSGVWTKPKNSDKACGSCHGLPPPAPHPQAENCSACHGQVIDKEGTFTHPSRHVDGIVQYDPSECQECHGDDVSPAPPVDTLGNVEPSFVGVGAHRAHVLGTDRSRAVRCSECHEVPEQIEDEGHIDGPPAEVLLSGVSETGMRHPEWDRKARSCGDTWCHGPGERGGSDSPEWTSEGQLSCESCHGAPPANPHPQMTLCATCHGEVVRADGAIIAPGFHVDGIVQVDVPNECTGCHGSRNPAPPSDVSGNTEATFAGVGAHQTHVLGTDISRAVPCDECHVVPSEVFSNGHIDTSLPAELRFSGVAVSYGAPIEYQEGTCKDSYCHGAVFFDGRLSGGSNIEPNWTELDGSQAACGTCHGLPPPPGHPQYTDCAYCHRNVKPDNRSFFDPSLHVNGITENYIP